jgi:hypothetical protein
MTMRTLAVAAAVALCPAMLVGQARSDTTKPNNPVSQATQDTTKKATTTSSAAGEVSAQVSPEVQKARQDPNLIGSPAWWSNHSTADGKPVSAGARTKKPGR